MPSYAELASEPPPGGTAWLAQVTPANMTTHLLAPMRVLYGKGPAAIGAAGDNNHLYGRHRSRDWCLSSRYCTNKFYGTSDNRDRQGAGNIYRAVDVGITGQPLYDACRRLDAAVRAGQLPGVAEWFGTFDGKTVVGWFEGHASSSDDSHLWHAHIGFWNGYADNEATMRAVYATFTGEGDDMALRDDPDFRALIERVENMHNLNTSGSPDAGSAFVSEFQEMQAKLDAILAGLGNITVVVTEAQIASAVRKELDNTKLTGA